VILAGVLLKLGGYGFIRFSLPMFPNGSAEFVPLMFVLSGIAIVYTSLVALVQTDMKKLIAYSSVAHMGFVTFGLFAMNRQGVEGAMIVMLSHGLVSGALFLVVGVVYDRLHTREIERYGGLADNMPGYALLFMIFTMASVGLPGTSGFVGEFLSSVGTYKASTWGAIAATTGIILGAATCCGSTGGSALARRATPTRRRCPISAPANGHCSPRLRCSCSGWAFIRKPSCVRSAMTWAGCWCGSPALLPRVIRH
jgi:NADH-quinone oxidoreductase subunit M